MSDSRKSHFSLINVILADFHGLDHYDTISMDSISTSTDPSSENSGKVNPPDFLSPVDPSFYPHLM